MATSYTSLLRLAQPVQGELSGTWGTVINDNITAMVEEAVAGSATIDTWVADSATLSTANGSTDESRNALLNLTDTTTDLTGAGTLICPTSTKQYIVNNDTGQQITVKTSAGTGVAIPDGSTALVYCDGTNVVVGNNFLSGGVITGGTIDNAVIGGSTAVAGTFTTLIGTTVTTTTLSAPALTATLAADLNVGSSSIVSSSNGDIAITPNGTGDVVLDGLKWPQADGTADYVLKTDGAGQLSWTAEAAGGISNVVEDTTPQMGGNLDVNGNSIVSVSNGDIPITPNGTGDVILDGLKWPQADGTADYVLKTDGAGQLSWAVQSAVGAAAIDDLTDVTIIGPADNEVLAYDGVDTWVNQTAAEAGLAAASHNHSGVYEPADATLIKEADVDDTPVNGVITAPISSNWAYDHENAADPHSQYIQENETITLSGDVSGTGTTAISVTVSNDSHTHGTSTIAGLDTADVTTGTFATGRISEASVTQHKIAIHTDVALTGPVAEEDATHSQSSGTLVLDPANGLIQRVTLSENVTTVTDNLANGEYVSLHILDGASAYTISWPAGWKWAGGSTPTLDATNMNVIEVWRANSVTYAASVGVMTSA